MKKDEKELEKGFGQGPTFQLPVRGVQKTEDGTVKMVTVMLFGDKDHRRKVLSQQYNSLQSVPRTLSPVAASGWGRPKIDCCSPQERMESKNNH